MRVIPGLLILAVVSVLPPVALHAAPGPLSQETAVENLPLPGERWWQSCTDARGIRTTLVPHCSDADCSEPGPLFIERTGPAGELLSEPFRVTGDAPAVFTYFRVTCHTGGVVLAQWRDAEEECYVHRLLDADGNPTTPAHRTAPARYDCRARPSVALRRDGAFLAAWGAAKLFGGSGVVAQAFAADGKAANESVIVSDGVSGWNRQPKISIDETDTALVVWSGDSFGEGAAPIFARFVDVAAAPIGEVMRVDTFGFGRNAPPTVTAEGNAEFSVMWSNPYQGGRVARRVGLDAKAVAPVSAFAEPPAHTPNFGAPRIVDSWPAVNEDLEPENAGLATLPDSRWLARFRGGVHQISGSDGSRWSAPAVAGPGNRAEVAIAAGGDGVVVALLRETREDVLYSTRSEDGGETWSKANSLAPVVVDGRSCPSCALEHAALTASEGGMRWIAAWSVAGPVAAALPDGAPRPTRVYTLASSDAGRTWGKVRTVAKDVGAGSIGFDVAMNSMGTSVILWIDEHVRLSRSVDAGSTWSPAVSLAANVSCGDCALSRRKERAQLSHDDLGTWIAIFASARYASEMYGYDGDVFTVRSLDDGRTWSPANAIAPYAATDGSRELQPSIAVDGNQRWAALWASHRPLDANDEMDPDIVMAISMDRGATWSPPEPVRKENGAGPVLDWAPLVAVDADGVWLMTWQRREYGSTTVGSVEQVLAAAGDSDCGNRRIEAGEECDDGNGKDGDRCDSNCTRPRCGNGVITEGEECDDGNHRSDDGCMLDCLPARCGDGVVQSPTEECDDGNVDDGDECPSTCSISHCGDGYVDPRLEECDDGNGDSGDSCTEECRVARCGDGYVHDYVEACDDGNTDDDDNCPNTCDRAFCGDGHTSKGIEECDPEDPLYREVCTEDCRTIDICGDADGDGEVSVIDVQRMLGRAVGHSVRCPREVCDMDGSGTVRARDARIGVSAAVGIDVGERCSIGTGNLVFWIDYSGEIGALQIEIDYAETGGSFSGSGGEVECEILAADVDDQGEIDDESVGFASFNDIDARSQLNVAMVSIPGFSGPMDLFRCAFVLPEEREGVRLGIRPVDASDTELAPITPPPLLGYRLE